jgi:hypothetical protein
MLFIPSDFLDGLQPHRMLFICQIRTLYILLNIIQPIIVQTITSAIAPTRAAQIPIITIRVAIT